MGWLHHGTMTKWEKWMSREWRHTERKADRERDVDGWMAGLPDPPSPVSNPPSVYHCPAEIKGNNRVTTHTPAMQPSHKPTLHPHPLTHPTYPGPKRFLHCKSSNSNTHNVHTATYKRTNIDQVYISLLILRARWTIINVHGHVKTLQELPIHKKKA